MIPEKLWQFSLKIRRPFRRRQGRGTGALEILELFRQKFPAGFQFSTGYVIQPFWNDRQNYTEKYAPQTQAEDLENADLPVENKYFSTVSTDFSTALFHRHHAAVYTGRVNIMRKR